MIPAPLLKLPPPHHIRDVLDGSGKPIPLPENYDEWIEMLRENAEQAQRERGVQLVLPGLVEEERR